MAAGRESRAERLNERLRGAQRVNVSDDSFNLDLAGLGVAAAPPSTSSQGGPSSPAKRRRLDNGATASASNEKSARRLSPRTKDPYELPNTSKESAGPENTTPTRNPPGSGSSHTSRAARRTVTSPQAETDPDELESLPPPSSVRPGTRPRSGAVVDEIEESPVDAPGSGKRKSVRLNTAATSSARLQDALHSDENVAASSSPLMRKSRMSEAAASARSERTARQTPTPSLGDYIDELSRYRPGEPGVADDEPSEAGTHQGRQDVADPQDLTQEQQQPEESDEDDGEAEEIDAAEAAEALGRKRPRRITRAASPELGSNDVGEQEPARKRRRGRPRKSPATQKQGAAKTKSTLQKRPQSSKTGDQSNPKAPPKPRRNSDDGDAAFEVTVQRFINHKRRGGEDGDNDDPLQLDIPFANRSGESAVDVFAQVCDEVIGNTLAQFQEVADNATDAARKKEFRIKVRAVEAYREVLNSRLLQHTIHLDHWNSLRKRLRHTQKEKLALREEIMRLKAEREEVALRMDAVRMKHEADTKESTFLLNTSSTMRDIDFVVAKGREAAELPAKEQKEAELANLEMAVAQISDQASSASSTGGLLNQIQDFNAFLERAAVALESR